MVNGWVYPGENYVYENTHLRKEWATRQSLSDDKTMATLSEPLLHAILTKL